MRGLVSGRKEDGLPGDEEAVRREGVYHALEGEFAFSITDARLRTPLAGRRDDFVAWLGALIPYEDWEAVVPAPSSPAAVSPGGSPGAAAAPQVDADALRLAALWKKKFAADPPPSDPASRPRSGRRFRPLISHVRPLPLRQPLRPLGLRRLRRDWPLHGGIPRLRRRGDAGLPLPGELQPRQRRVRAARRPAHRQPAPRHGAPDRHAARVPGPGVPPHADVRRQRRRLPAGPAALRPAVPAVRPTAGPSGHPARRHPGGPEPAAPDGARSVQDGRLDGAGLPVGVRPVRQRAGPESPGGGAADRPACGVDRRSVRRRERPVGLSKIVRRQPGRRRSRTSTARCASGWAA